MREGVTERWRVVARQQGGRPSVHSLSLPLSHPPTLTHPPLLAIHQPRPVGHAHDLRGPVGRRGPAGRAGRAVHWKRRRDDRGAAGGLPCRVGDPPGGGERSQGWWAWRAEKVRPRARSREREEQSAGCMPSLLSARSSLPLFIHAFPPPTSLAFFFHGSFVCAHPCAPRHAAHTQGRPSGAPPPPPERAGGARAPPPGARRRAVCPSAPLFLSPSPMRKRRPRAAAARPPADSPHPAYPPPACALHHPPPPGGVESSGQAASGRACAMAEAGPKSQG